MSYGAIEQEEIFAGGEWLTPHAAARIELESPVDFRRTGGAVDGDERDVDTAVRAAREAFDHGPWPRMSPEERAGWLERLADEIERRADATVSLVTTEIGQPVSIARPWAGIRPIAHLRFYAQLLRRPDAVEEVRENAMRPGTTIVQHEPLGVAALIVPWNHPQASTTLKLAPALAAGSTVVVKPAPESPLDISNMAEASISDRHASRRDQHRHRRAGDRQGASAAPPASTRSGSPVHRSRAATSPRRREHSSSRPRWNWAGNLPRSCSATPISTP